MARRISLCGLAAACVIALSGSALAARELVGHKAPEISISGKLNFSGALSLKASRGQVVLLEFWATWCPPCRATIPHLQKLHKAYRGKGLRIISISAEKGGTIRPFVRRQGGKMAYPIGFDRSRRTSSTYGISTIPSAFLIDTKGVVIWQGHPLQLKNQQIEEALEQVDPKALQASGGSAQIQWKVFHLQDGAKVVGRRLGSMGKITFIKTKEGKTQRVQTSDILKTEDQPATAEPAGGSAVKKGRAEEGAFQEIRELAGKRVHYSGDRDKYKQDLRQKYADTVAQADRFLAKYPQSAHRWQAAFWKADAAVRGSFFDNDEAKRGEGIALLETMLTAGAPADLASRAHLLLSYVKAASGASKALDHAKQAAETATDDDVATQAYYQLGGLYQGQDNIDQAKAAYQTLIDKYPRSGMAKTAKNKLKALSIVGTEMTDLKFTALDGSQVDIASYKGKVVLIDFWATWCGPCLAEMPNVKKAYEAHRSEGFEIIGISLDESKDKVEDYLREQGISWPQYFDGKGWKNKISTSYGISSIPATFLLDRKGVVKYVNIGGRRLEEAVKELLAEK